jgi:hypothetical protein
VPIDMHVTVDFTTTPFAGQAGIGSSTHSHVFGAVIWGITPGQPGGSTVGNF